MALAGCFGIVIVIGLPWAVAKLGALPVFVGLIAAQLLTSALWDRLVDGAHLPPTLRLVVVRDEDYGGSRKSLSPGK